MNIPALIKAEIGIVSIHAQKIFLVTPHLTAEAPFTAPTPIIEPVIVWVVLTGMPAAAVANSVTAAPDSAQKPPKGSSLVIFEPMVLTMRHPPQMVPSARAE